MPGLALARFVARYGAAALRLPWPQTSDGFIPVRLFGLLLRAADSVNAQARLDLAQAVGLGTHGDKGGSIIGREVRLAFPESSDG